MTASHSSSFIRSSRLSRVMPALLTRMVIGVHASPRWRRARCRPGRGVGDVELHAGAAIARHRRAARAIFAAPSSVVAVPITVAPSAASRSAIARPMPRVAPVTSAVLAGKRSVAHGRKSPRASATATRFPPRRDDGVAVGQRVRVHSVGDAPGQPGQHLAGPALDDVRDAAVGHRAHGRRPVHGVGRLPRERIADRVGLVMLGDVDVVNDRDRGVLRSGSARAASASFSAAGRSSVTVKRRRHRQQHAALRALLLGETDGPLDRLAVDRRSRLAPAR